MNTPIELLQYGQLIKFNEKTYKVVSSKPLQLSFCTKLSVKSMTDNGMKYEMLTFPINAKVYAV